MDFEIKNIGNIKFDNESNNSNEVMTAVVVPKILTIEKKVDKDKASVCDILTYTIIIKNPGKQKISHIIFTDAYDDELVEYVDDSFEVDGVKVTPEDVNPIKYTIQHIEAESGVVIEFKVKIKDQ